MTSRAVVTPANLSKDFTVDTTVLDGRPVKINFSTKLFARDPTSGLIAPSLTSRALASGYPTVAVMKSDATLAAGDHVKTRGYVALHDGGWARYIVMTPTDFGGVPDGVADHYTVTGLVLKLVRTNDFVAERYGALGGEVSARLQAAWDDMIKWQNGASTPCNFSYSSSGTLKNQFRMTGLSNTRAVNVDIDFGLSKLTAVTGGNLSDTNAMFLCRLNSGVHLWGELDGGKFAATYDFFSVGSTRGFNPVARHYKGFGFRVRGGGNGTFALYNPICSEYVQSDPEFDTQSNFTARGFSVEDGDFAVWNANILWNKAGIYFSDEPVQVHFINAHIVGGNPNWATTGAPFVNMVLVENHSARENHLDICYFDNGVVDDYQNTLNITGGHYVQNGAATLTEPKIRQYPQLTNQVNMPDINIRALAGCGSIGFLNTGGFTWAGDMTAQAAYYTGMCSKNSQTSMQRTRYNLYPASEDLVEVNLKLQGKFETRWRSGTGSIGRIVDPATSTITHDARVLRVSPATGNRQVFLGGGDNGISESEGAGGILNLHSGGAIKWKSDATGDFLPGADGTQTLGRADSRLKRGFFSALSVGSANATITGGTGTPEGAVVASKGSLYVRDDGTTGTLLYIKTTASTNAGWVAIA